MKDPVNTVDGQVYERNAISEWFRRCRRGGVKSPKTGLTLQSLVLTPNLALRHAIEEYLKMRPYLERKVLDQRSLEEAALELEQELIEKGAATEAHLEEAENVDAKLMLKLSSAEVSTVEVMKQRDAAVHIEGEMAEEMGQLRSIIWQVEADSREQTEVLTWRLEKTSVIEERAQTSVVVAEREAAVASHLAALSLLKLSRAEDGEQQEADAAQSARLAATRFEEAQARAYAAADAARSAAAAAMEALLAARTRAEHCIVAEEAAHVEALQAVECVSSIEAIAESARRAEREASSRANSEAMALTNERQQLGGLAAEIAEARSSALLAVAAADASQMRAELLFGGEQAAQCEAGRAEGCMRVAEIESERERLAAQKVSIEFARCLEELADLQSRLRKSEAYVERQQLALASEAQVASFESGALMSERQRQAETKAELREADALAKEASKQATSFIEEVVSGQKAEMRSFEARCRLGEERTEAAALSAEEAEAEALSQLHTFAHLVAKVEAHTQAVDEKAIAGARSFEALLCEANEGNAAASAALIRVAHLEQRAEVAEQATRTEAKIAQEWREKCIARARVLEMANPSIVETQVEALALPQRRRINCESLSSELAATPSLRGAGAVSLARTDARQTRSRSLPSSAGSAGALPGRTSQRHHPPVGRMPPARNRPNGSPPFTPERRHTLQSGALTSPPQPQGSPLHGDGSGSTHNSSVKCIVSSRHPRIVERTAEFQPLIASSNCTSPMTMPAISNFPNIHSPICKRRNGSECDSQGVESQTREVDRHSQRLPTNGIAGGIGNEMALEDEAVAPPALLRALRGRRPLGGWVQFAKLLAPLLGGRQLSLAEWRTQVCHSDIGLRVAYTDSQLLQLASDFPEVFGVSGSSHLAVVGLLRRNGSDHAPLCPRHHLQLAGDSADCFCAFLTCSALHDEENSLGVAHGSGRRPQDVDMKTDLACWIPGNIVNAGA